MHVRSALNYSRKAASEAVTLRCTDPSLARQEMKDEADINTIVRNFGVTGKIQAPARLPTFSDFEDVWDFQSAMNSIREAERLFNQVPAKVRERFANDPGKFVAFCSDPENLPELRTLGLAPAANAPATLVPAPPAEGPK